jgi:hypothetical protein
MKGETGQEIAFICKSQKLKPKWLELLKYHHFPWLLRLSQ